MANDNEHWAVDKRIPLALIISLALQTAGFAFWMGQLSTRVAQNERVISGAQNTSDRLTRLEVTLENVAQGMSRVERELAKK